jgi:hypothetical protein
MRWTFFLAVVLLLCLWSIAYAHDAHVVGTNMKQWFDGLQSGMGACCSNADGTALSDVDWESRDGRYRVKIEGKWIDVPDNAVLKVPNLAGPTMVWPIKVNNGIAIRCFIPGTMI